MKVSYPMIIIGAAVAFAVLAPKAAALLNPPAQPFQVQAKITGVLFEQCDGIHKSSRERLYMPCDWWGRQPRTAEYINRPIMRERALAYEYVSPLDNQTRYGRHHTSAVIDATPLKVGDMIAVTIEPEKAGASKGDRRR